MSAAISALATIVDTTALWETVVAAVVAGIGVSAIFSVAIFAAARFGELGREGRSAPALAYGALAVVSGVAFLSAIAGGLWLMATD